MIHYEFDEFVKDVRELSLQIQKEFKPEVILAVARGGLTLGHFLAMRLDNRLLFSLNSIHYDDTARLESLEIFNIPDLSEYKRVLIVDDIIDSGESMQEILRLLRGKFPHIDFKVASIFYKSQALLEPDFKLHQTSEWIEFFWEKMD